MRLPRRGSHDATKKNHMRLNDPGKYDSEKGLIQSTPSPMPKSPENRTAEPVHSGAPKVLRRQDYADVYTIGRRASSAQPPLGRTGSSIAFGGFNAGAAVAYRGQARRLRVNPRLLLMVAFAAVLTVAVVFGVSALAGGHASAKGQQVLFDGRMLCIAQSQDAVEKALVQIQTDLKNTYGMDTQRPASLTYAPVTCDSQNICTDAQITQVLKDNMDIKVMASVIRVNDRPAVALKSAGEAQQALDTVLAPFQSTAQNARTDIAFVENVQIQQLPIDYGLVQPLEDAVRTLTLGTNVEDNLYTVKKGDSLAKIAKKFELKVSDIRKANPALASEVIQPGQELNAVKPNNWVNVRYTQTVTRQEALPFETVKQTSATMYTTQKEVTQKGKNGQREVVAKVTYINGMEALKEILSQTVITAAQNQIELRGTKKVPTNAGGSSGGSSGTTGRFTFPLKDYRITSTFCKRTLDGVTKWHYGVDLAAPIGTPIYASRSGTINYAGSASGYGLLIMIDHGGGIQTRYGHCSKLLVKKGQKVNKGQIIGLVGSTGHSTGPHCHFEIRINGTPVDPQKYD